MVLEIPPAPGITTFRILKYEGSLLNGDETNFVLQNAGNYRGVTFAHDAANKAITLNVQNATHGWTGVENDDWEVDGTRNNWSALGGTFFDGDTISFTNMGASAVILTEDVAPAAITFDSSDDFNFTGSFSLNSGGGLLITNSGNVKVDGPIISGITAITLAGSGRLEMLNEQTFTGDLTVRSNATFYSRNNKAYGDVSKEIAITVEPGGCLYHTAGRDHKSYDSASFVISGHGIGDGNGALRSERNKKQNDWFGDELAFDGDTTIKNIARADIDGSIHTTAAADAAGGVELTKIGAGSLRLNGNNSGAKLKKWIVNNGNLEANKVNALQSSVAGGLADIELNGGNLLCSIDADSTHTIANDVIFNASGDWLRTDGDGDGESFVLSGDLNLVANGRIDIQQPTTFSGTLTGAGNLTKEEAAAAHDDVLRWDLGPGDNTHTGEIIINSGTIRTDSTTAFNNNAVTVGDSGDEKLVLNGNNNTIGSLAGVGIVENDNATAAALTVGTDNTSSTFSGILTNGAAGGALSYVKTGSGTNTLSGANVHTGTTTVNGGTLLINGDSSGATGAVTVNIGAKLGGTGSIGGVVTAANGGTVMAGTSIESLGVSNNVVFSDGSEFEYEVDSAEADASVAADLMVVDGDVTLTGTATLAVTNLAGALSDIADITTYTLINYSGDLAGEFTIGGTARSDGDSFVHDGRFWAIDYDATSGAANYAGEYEHDYFVNLVALGDEAIWDGETDGDWNTGTNWLDNIVPVESRILTFTGEDNTTTTNDITADTSFGGIVFANDGNTSSNAAFTLTGNSIVLAGDVTNAVMASGSLTDTIDLDMELSGDPTMTVNPDHNLTLSGELTGDRLIKAGAGTVTVSNANTHAGFTVTNGTLVLEHGGGLGTSSSLANTDTVLEVADGVTANGALTIASAGGTKTLQLESGTAKTAAYAGTITLEEESSGSFKVNANSTAGNYDFSQVLTVSGQVTGAGFDANEIAIDLFADGIVQLANSANDFTGNIRLRHGGSGLRIPNDAALSSASVILDSGDTKVQLLSGVNVDNALQATDRYGMKQIRLMPGSGISATWSGPINVLEETDGNFALVPDGSGGNWDGTQVLTIAGQVTSTAGAGITIDTDGVVELSNAANDITGNVKIDGDGSILRILNSGALGSPSSNQWHASACPWR